MCDCVAFINLTLGWGIIINSDWTVALQYTVGQFITKAVGKSESVLSFKNKMN